MYNQSSFLSGIVIFRMSNDMQAWTE